jgi:hypothetical protein
MRKAHEIIATGLTTVALAAGAGELSTPDRANAHPLPNLAETDIHNNSCNPALEVRALARHIKKGEAFNARVLVPKSNEDHSVIEKYVDWIGDDPFLNQLYPDKDKMIRPPFLVNPLVLCANGIKYLAARDEWGEIKISPVDERARFLAMNTDNYRALLSRSPNPLGIAKVVTRRVHVDPKSSKFGFTDTKNDDRTYGTYVS